MRIYLLGSSGFVAKGFKEFFKIKNIKFHSINKKNYNKYKNTSCDVLINTAGNSSTILAKKNFLTSYNKNVNLIIKTLKDFKFNQYVLISSTLVYNDTSKKLNTNENSLIDIDKLENYGYLKLIAEQIIKRNVNQHLIIRTSGLVGNNLKKNVIYDILNRVKIFDNKKSKFHFITTKRLAEIIFNLFSKKINGTFNITSNKNMKVEDIKNILTKKKIQYSISNKKVYNISIFKLSKVAKIFSSEKYIKEFFYDNN